MRCKIKFTLAISLLMLAGCTQQHSVSIGPDGKAIRQHAVTTEKLDLGNNLAINFSHIDEGNFMMGSPADEANRDSDETQHKVIISKPFLMAQTEVTQAQYQAIMGDNPSLQKGDDLPVDSVSWEKAEEFCQKLSTKAGKRIHLPTEAQWEFACRAGTTDPFQGASPVEDIAWTPDNSQNMPHPVAGKKANANGLFDMLGNTWEWCADTYADYPTGTAKDPFPNANGPHVIRGGAYAGNTPGLCRSANRGRSAEPGPLIGFRVAMDAN